MKRESSCVNSRVILDYVQQNNNGDCREMLGDLDAAIDGLDDPESFLRDPNNWISRDVIAKLWRRARRILNDDRVAFKTARFAIEERRLGYALRIVFKAFWSSGKALRHLQKINDQWNRSKRMELVSIERTRAVVRLHWHPDSALTKDMCLYNQGAFTFMRRVWGGEPIEVTETCCQVEGAPYCEYRLQWPARNRLHELWSRLFTSKAVLRETIAEMQRDKQVIEDKYAEVNRLNLELRSRVRQLTAIQETGKAILSILDINRLLDVIMNLLSNVTRVQRAVILLVDEDSRSLSYLHGIDTRNPIPAQVRNYSVSMDRVSNILVRVASTGHAEYVPEVSRSTLHLDNLLLVHGRPTSVYVVPLITRSRIIGVIATDAVEGRGVPSETRDLLAIFAPQVAIAIENARLYRRLQQQMEDIKRSRVLLGRAEKLSFLGELAARLAHEIKNPLTALDTFIQMLPHKFEDPEFRENFYEIAREETRRVNDLVTELLDLARPRESHFEAGDLHGLIARMARLVAPQAKARQIQLRQYLDPTVERVWMDSEKIKQVLLNLFSNAIEFTPAGGNIDVRTAWIAGNGAGGHIRVEVADGGPGIPPELQDRVFDPYFTTRHRSELHSGTGLGLFIAHQLMEDHHGAIQVRNGPDGGAVFVLTLPAGVPVEPAGAVDEN